MIRRIWNLPGLKLLLSGFLGMPLGIGLVAVIMGFEWEVVSMKIYFAYVGAFCYWLMHVITHKEPMKENAHEMSPRAYRFWTGKDPEPDPEGENLPTPTPGEYRAERNEGMRPPMHSDLRVVAPGSTPDRVKPICRLELQGEESMANAAMFALAPEMLKILRQISEDGPLTRPNPYEPEDGPEGADLYGYWLAAWERAEQARKVLQRYRQTLTELTGKQQ